MSVLPYYLMSSCSKLHGPRAKIFQISDQLFILESLLFIVWEGCSLFKCIPQRQQSQDLQLQSLAERKIEKHNLNFFYFSLASLLYPCPGLICNNGAYNPIFFVLVAFQNVHFPFSYKSMKEISHGILEHWIRWKIRWWKSHLLLYTSKAVRRWPSK